jgi:TPR repeat protein
MKAANLEKGAVGQRLQVQASRRWRRQPASPPKQKAPDGEEKNVSVLLRERTPQELFAEGEEHMFGTGTNQEYHHQQAVSCYLRAAAAGYAPAAAALGICYTDGVGVDKDVLEGARWYMRAMEEYNLHEVANQGDAAAQCELGDM